MASTSPDPAVSEYGAFTPGAQVQLESVFLLKDAGTGAQTVAGGSVTFSNQVVLSGGANITGSVTAGGLVLLSAQNNFACAGNAGNAQNYANGTKITAAITAVITANANNNSCILPASLAGMELSIFNANSGVTISVFPNQNEHINFAANNAAYTLATNNCSSFYCPVAGTWMAAQLAIA